MTSQNDDNPPVTGAGGRAGLRDQCIAILLFLITVVFWWDSIAIRAAEARMYPRLILGVMGFLSFLLFIRGARMDRSVTRDSVISSVPGFIAFTGMTAIYAVSVGYVGFFTSSFFYVPIAARLIGLTNHWIIAVVTIVFLVAAWLVFVALFARPLPAELFLGGS